MLQYTHSQRHTPEGNGSRALWHWLALYECAASSLGTEETLLYMIPRILECATGP